MKTKADIIRELSAKGMASGAIAKIAGCKTRYVCVVRWCDRHPGYKTAWVRNKRRTDPDYYRRELKQQAEYTRRRRARSAGAELDREAPSTP